MWAGSQRPTPKPMGHFDPLVPQTIIGWKPPDEIKCSKRTLDHKEAKGHFDTLDAALQVVILTTWKYEIKGSFWTFDFRMDTACPPCFDKLKLTVLTVQICYRPRRQFYGLDRRKTAFFRFWHLKTYPTPPRRFLLKNPHFPRFWPSFFDWKTPYFKNKPKLGGRSDYK